MKQRILKNKENIYVFIGILTFAFIICSNFLKVHFALDTYCQYSSGYVEYAKCFFRSARIFSGLELLLAKLLDVTLFTNLKLLSVFGIINLSIAVFILYTKAVKELDLREEYLKKLLILLSSFAIIFNFGTIETLIYAESGFMCLGILFAVIAACVFNSDIKRKNLISILILTLSGICYQAMPSIFIPIAMIFAVYRKRDNNKKIIKNMFMTLAIYAVAMAINLVILRLMAIAFPSELRETFIPSIKSIINTLISFGKIIIIQNIGIQPNYLIIIILAIFTLVYVIYNRINKESLSKLMYYIIILLIAILLPIAPLLVQAPSTQYLEPRFGLAFFATLGLAILYIVLNSEITKKQLYKKAITFFSIAIFIMNSMYFVRQSSEHITTNILDKNAVCSVLEDMYEYEENTGYKIEKIGYCHDKNVNTYYDGVKPISSINCRGLWIDWTIVEIFELYSGRNFELVETPQDIYVKNFEGKDWSHFNNKQVVFSENSMYICIF